MSIVRRAIDCEIDNSMNLLIFGKHWDFAGDSHVDQPMADDVGGSVD